MLDSCTCIWFRFCIADTFYMFILCWLLLYVCNRSTHPTDSMISIRNCHSHNFHVISRFEFILAWPLNRNNDYSSLCGGGEVQVGLPLVFWPRCSVLMSDVLILQNSTKEISPCNYLEQQLFPDLKTHDWNITDEAINFTILHIHEAWTEIPATVISTCQFKGIQFIGGFYSNDADSDTIRFTSDMFLVCGKRIQIA